jgi:lincosamide and streptogramin A transport system ATP-binding/permease protein
MKRAIAIQNRQIDAIEEKSGLLKNIEDTDDLKISAVKYHSQKLLYLEHVSIRYGEHEVCRDVSFSIEQGDSIALCGKNGSGKSSILKLILGDNLDYSGNLHIGSQLKISYVPQDASELTGMLTDYAAAQGIDESLFKAILRKLDFQRVQFEKNMDAFSGGQKKKVLIARSLCEQAHLYIWDEPLNFIDVLSRIQIEKLLKTFKPSILFVEHDKAFCDNIATKVINL